MINLDTPTPVIQAAWERLKEAEYAAQAAREHLIAVTNRETHTRPSAASRRKRSSVTQPEWVALALTVNGGGQLGNRGGLVESHSANRSSAASGRGLRAADETGRPKLTGGSRRREREPPGKSHQTRAAIAIFVSRKNVLTWLGRIDKDAQYGSAVSNGMRLRPPRLIQGHDYERHGE